MKTRTILLILAISLPFTEALSQMPDRSQPPAVGPPPEMKAPSVQRLQLKNGLQVILVEKHEVPLVQINLQVIAGSVLDTKGNVGLASMTADLLDEGAGGRDALELADAVDFLGANLRTSAGYHTAVISLNVPLRQIDAALPLLADVALKPTFAVADLSRKRDERLTDLIQDRDEARAIASEQFNQIIFGKNHPYGRPSSGDATGLKGLTTKKISKFYRKFYRPNNAALVVVGDITADEIMPQLERYFGSWKKKRVKTPKWTDVSQVSGRTIYLVDKPGAAQSEIRIGRVGVPRITDDYFTLRVLNTILGGAFTSRLNQNLREEHGYSYGARSSFVMRPHAGPFIASAAVQTDVTDKALTEFMNELRGILEEVPADELSKSQNYVALGYPANFQTVARVANQLQNLVLYNLPDETFSKFSEGIYGVSSAGHSAAAWKYIDPDNIAIVVVGDREVVEEGIRALNLGNIVNLTIEDVMGPIPTVGMSK